MTTEARDKYVNILFLYFAAQTFYPAPIYQK